VNPTEASQQSLAGLGPEATAALIAAATDVALLVDGEGVIRDVSVGSDDFALEGCQKWVGRTWEDTVTSDSRAKVAALLRDAAAKSPRKWRHINHPSAVGADVPVLYSAIQVGSEGRVVAFGRDLRALAALQQRLVAAQQSMERDYLRLRQLETRYRLLFQTGSEAVLIVDSATMKVVEVNPAAAHVIGEPVKRIVGRPLVDFFASKSKAAVLSLLGGVAAAGQGEELTAQLAAGHKDSTVSASLFRQENGALFLVRLSPLASGPLSTGASNIEAMLLKVVESVPDGFVVTDSQGRILTANAAFVEMIQLGGREQLQGESLDRWLGGTGVDLNVLLANLRQHGAVRLFATTLRGELGASLPVEISATSVTQGEQTCLGFTMRDVGRRLAPEPRGERELLRSASQLTELVGRVPLKDIVGETTDLIEQLCIEAALELTQDNRASASEMLGLSRQSLYVKLRRYGLGDLGGEVEK
jgi:transcriptional regulator PpsR